MRATIKGQRWANWVGAMLSGCVVALCGTSVLAQNAPPPAAPGQTFVREAPARGETVTTRRRPQYDAVGIRKGSFFIYPSIEVTPTYDTNIFQTTNDRKQDFIYIISPEVVVRSNWRRHELNFGARADIVRYKTHTTENYEDASFTLNGRFDVQRDSFAFGGFRWAQRHEERGSPDEAGGVSPTQFWAMEGTLGYQQKFNRITARLEGLYRNLDYFDVRTVGGSGERNNDDRDRHETRGVLRVTYEVNPQIGVFGQVSGFWVYYKTRPDDNGFNRNNNGIEFNGGVAFDLSARVFGEVFAGFRRQWFKDGAFKPVSGPSGGVGVTWNVSGLTTVKGRVVRAIEQTTLLGASSFYSTQFSASIDHELRRNIILSAAGSFQLDDYQGNGREDKWYRASVSALWLANRHFRVKGAYNYAHRESNVGDQTFTRHLFLLTVTGQL